MGSTLNSSPSINYFDMQVCLFNETKFWLHVYFKLSISPFNNDKLYIDIFIMRNETMSN